MIEFETAREQLTTIERETGEQVKKTIKKLLAKVSNCPGFPEQLAENTYGSKGYLQNTLHEYNLKGLFVKPTGLFIASVRLGYGAPQPMMFDWQEAPTEVYQQFADRVIQHLDDHFRRRALLKQQIGLRQNLRTQGNQSRQI